MGPYKCADKKRSHNCWETKTEAKNKHSKSERYPCSCWWMDCYAMCVAILSTFCHKLVSIGPLFYEAKWCSNHSCGTGNKCSYIRSHGYFRSCIWREDGWCENCSRNHIYHHWCLYMCLTHTECSIINTPYLSVAFKSPMKIEVLMIKISFIFVFDNISAYLWLTDLKFLFPLIRFLHCL